MTAYEKLLAKNKNITIDDKSDLPRDLKGLYVNMKNKDVILINKNVETNKEKICILAEELGHYHTSHGNILDQSDINNRKQELKARRWGYEKLIGIIALVNAYNAGIRSRYELAEHLNVTEEFVCEAIKYYKEKHGLFYEIDNYIVYFEPFGVFKKL